MSVQTLQIMPERECTPVTLWVCMWLAIRCQPIPAFHVLGAVLTATVGTEHLNLLNMLIGIHDSRGDV